MEITCTHRGEFALALEHFDKAIALYTPERPCDESFFDALNPGVALRCFAALTLHSLGRHREAMAAMLDVALALSPASPSLTRYAPALTSYRDELTSSATP